MVWLDILQAWKAGFWLLGTDSDLASFLVSFIIQRLHSFAGFFVYLSIGGTCYRLAIFVLANKFCLWRSEQSSFLQFTLVHFEFPQRGIKEAAYSWQNTFPTFSSSSHKIKVCNNTFCLINLHEPLPEQYILAVIISISKLRCWWNLVSVWAQSEVGKVIGCRVLDVSSASDVYYDQEVFGLDTDW